MTDKRRFNVNDKEEVETVAVPQYLMRHGIVKLELSLEEVGVAMTLASYEGEISFDEFVEEVSTHGSDEEDRLSTFEIRKIVRSLQDKEIVRLILLKDKYQIEWLPKAFGE